MSARYFGASVARSEDARLLTGQGLYVDDIEMPGLLHVAFVRSPMAHARIKSIDLASARAMPGVVAAYTMGDFADLAEGPMPPMAPHPLIKEPLTCHPLAQTEVCYVGEAIAMVVAQDRALAESAAMAVMVDLQELPGVADARAALATDSAPVHLGRDSNLLASLHTKFGDVAAAFAAADHSLTESFATHRGGCHAMECRGVVATYDQREDHLSIYTSSQAPFMVRRHLATYLARDEQTIRVAAPDVGGGFGPKATVYPEEFAVALGALKLGQPLKWIEDRQEHFVATNQQRDQFWTLDVAFTKTGKILGLKGHGIHDSGAYAPYGLILPGNALVCFPGPYALQAIDIHLDVALTNLVPTSPVRGASRPNVAFILERIIDKVARYLGLSRDAVRAASFVRASQMPYFTGGVSRDGSRVSYDSGDYQKALDLALEKIGAADFATRQRAALKRGKLLGLGLASCVEDTGIGPFEGASLRITPKGKLVVATGAAPQCQGHATVLAQIAADELAMDMADITVEAGDTGRFPLGLSTVGSRIAVTAGSSVHVAAQKLRSKALHFASLKLEVSADDLELSEGAVQVKGVPGLKIPLADIARALAGTTGVPLPGGMEPDLAATAYFESSGVTFAYGSNACEVEIDAETGDTRVTRYVVVHDCGRMINPMIVEGQIRGGVVHGIGNALFERMLHDEQGQPLTTTYGEYLLPMACEMPNIEIHHLETPSPRNPLGVKGAGEAGTIPAAPCVISAIENALEAQLGKAAPFITHHPVSPLDVVDWLDDAQ